LKSEADVSPSSSGVRDAAPAASAFLS